MVLFPNTDQLIDVNVVKVFLSHNPVPTLLRDILLSLYTRTLKRRGTLLCCTPLLARWFISHLPWSTLKNEHGLKWSRRLMSLTHSDIHWCSRSLENVPITDRYGEFPYVPLLGIRGGITYNPCFVLRQFGYARRDVPHDTLVQGITFDYENDVQGYPKRFI